MAKIDPKVAKATSPLPDLRALTRDTVRRKIAETAWSVFAERGFEEVTVEAAARAAGISRASFFRYFGCKEEAVFVAVEAMGAEVAAALSGRPAGEDAWTALRQALQPALRGYAKDPKRSLARHRLISETPALRGHQLELQAHWRRMIGAALAGRLGEKPGGLQTEALAGSAISALDAALDRWASRNGEEPLGKLIDAAFAAIEAPAPHLR